MAKINLLIPKIKTLPISTKRNLHEIIVRMGNEKPVAESTIRHIGLKNSHKNNGHLFYGGRTTANTTFNFNKTFVTVNSISGDVVNSNKSFFKSWNKIFKKIDKFLNNIDNNYSDTTKVEKKDIEYNSFLDLFAKSKKQS